MCSDFEQNDLVETLISRHWNLVYFTRIMFEIVLVDYSTNYDNSSKDNLFIWQPKRTITYLFDILRYIIDDWNLGLCFAKTLR